MIGRLLRISSDGPVRNVSVTSGSDGVECSISVPRGPVPIERIAAMAIGGTRIGMALAFGMILGVSILTVAALSHGVGNWWLFLAALAICGHLTARSQNLTVYSISLITRCPGQPEIVFYRTFNQFDLALMLDWVTAAAGGGLPLHCRGVLAETTSYPFQSLCPDKE